MLFLFFYFVYASLQFIFCNIINNNTNKQQNACKLQNKLWETNVIYKLRYKCEKVEDFISLIVTLAVQSITLAG